MPLYPARKETVEPVPPVEDKKIHGPRFDASTCPPDDALALEWLETDGLGGFSSSTVALANTRSYHALLNPAVRPPLGRMVLWARSQETLLVDGNSFPLDAHHTRNGIEPRGHENLRSFEARPFPRWIYRFPDGDLEREFFLRHGQGDAYLAFTWRGHRQADIVLRPLLAFRDHHTVVERSEDLFREARAHANGVSVRIRAEHPALWLQSPHFAFETEETWLENLLLPNETERGLDDREDLWSPGTFRAPLHPQQTVWIRAGIHEAHDADWEVAKEREIARRNALRLDALDAFPGLHSLAHAADQFLVKRGKRSTVIAGYPWFTDWGRDTMIALPGLTIATRRPHLARELLLTFAEHLADGLIPNRFPDEGEIPEYNTVDATLWMAVALWHTWEATKDRDLLKLLFPVLQKTREHHERGTRHGIRADSDGLLLAGEPGVQLTWMDAKVEDWVVTPRIGKPVEIQALWYNFLCIGAEIATLLHEDEKPWRIAANGIPKRFLDLFWDPQRGYLADVVAKDGTPDTKLRPNQLFALSLPHPLVEAETARAILTTVRAKLVTPRGLRSLSPDDPDYHPRYLGDRRTRDAAYHQGTVWGWLEGPYLDAVLRFEGEPGRAEALARLREWGKHLKEACLGQASEVFDADPPHTPRGCPAQAWTVAEILRIASKLAER